MRGQASQVQLAWGIFLGLVDADRRYPGRQKRQASSEPWRCVAGIEVSSQNGVIISGRSWMRQCVPLAGEKLAGKGDDRQRIGQKICEVRAAIKPVSPTFRGS
jgi:hypothetical protein